MRTTFRQALSSEAGDVLINSIAGAIVSVVAMGAVAAGITGISQFQIQQKVRADITNEASLTNASLRSDILWAADITPAGDRRVDMTVPGGSGGCEEVSWSIGTADTEDGDTEASDAATQVTLTTVSYPGLDSTADEPACTGEPAGTTTAVMISDASPQSTFTYAGADGRDLVFDGTGSGSPAAVALNTTVGASTDEAAPYRFSQAVRPAPGGTADAPVHQVPEADLR